MKFSLFFSLLITIIALIFALQNTDSTTLSFFSLTFTGSIASVTIVTFLIGVASGFLLLLPQIATSTFQARTLRKQNKQFQNQKEGKQSSEISKAPGEPNQGVSDEDIPPVSEILLTEKK